jgi:cytochrome bd-type quinol oxidase subunit 2
MNYRLMFIINAIGLALFGALFLVMPEFTLKLFDTETYAATLFVARFLGGVMIMAGVFIWLAKELNDARTEKTMVIMLLTSSVVGFVLTLVGIVSANVIRANGWVLLVVHILFVLGYGYLLSGVAIVPKSQQQYRQSP